jgi:prevent-host-death family protein
MNSVKIAEFKSHLSAYLARVRSGESITVCDRSTPVARLVPYETEDDLIIEPATPPSAGAGPPTPLQPVVLRKPADIGRILAELRSDR